MKLNIIIGVLCFIIAQTMTWFQLSNSGYLFINNFKDISRKYI